MMEPHFVRRKQPSKRRARSSFELSLESSHALPCDSRAPTYKAASAPLNSSQSASLATRPSRGRLRPPPTVPGYEPFSPLSQDSKKSRYSIKDLNALRSGTVSTPALPPNLSTPNASSDWVSPENSPSATPVIKGRNVLSSTEVIQSTGEEDIGSRDPSPRPKRADPFSEDWNRGVADPLLLAHDSDEGLLVNLRNATIAEQMSSGSDDDGDEWNQELLRRAGVNLTTAAKQCQRENFHREECIIRDAVIVDGIEDDNTIRVYIQRLLADVAKQVEEAKTFACAETEKCTIIEQAAKDADHAKQNVDKSTQLDVDTQQFYDRFASDMEKLSTALKINRQAMIEVREKRLKALQNHAKTVMDNLNNGVDEFGRVRRSGRGMPVPHQITINRFSEGRHPLVEIPEALRSITRLSTRFTDWKERYPQEYSGAHGDKGFGRFAGALGTCEPTLDWLLLLNQVQRTEACKVCDVVEEGAIMAQALWIPSDEESCETIGRILKSIAGCVDRGDKARLEAGLKKRISAEFSVANLANDGMMVWQLLNGALCVTRFICGDLGLSEIIEAATKVGCLTAPNAEGIISNLTWLVNTNLTDEFCSTTVTKQASGLLKKLKDMREQQHLMNGSG